MELWNASSSLQVHPDFDREQKEGMQHGRIPDIIKDLYADLSKHAIYIAGSPEFVDACIEAVKAQGAQAEMIHTEGFFDQAPPSHLPSLSWCDTKRCRKSIRQPLLLYSSPLCLTLNGYPRQRRQHGTGRLSPRHRLQSLLDHLLQQGLKSLRHRCAMALFCSDQHSTLINCREGLPSSRHRALSTAAG